MKIFWLAIGLILTAGPRLLSQEQKAVALPAHSKSAMFDIDLGNQPRQKSGFADPSKKEVKLETWAYSLMRNGYFTLGTNHGISNSILDNDCDISFGHPYAMTSFAYAVLDGKAYYPAAFQSNHHSEVFLTGDTLSATSDLNGILHAEVYLYTVDSAEVMLQYRITNSDSISHMVGLGMLLDAALGKWGDGFVSLHDTILNKVSTSAGSLLDSVTLWERREHPLGIGLKILSAGLTPDQVTFGNWAEEYDGSGEMDQLYDLAVHARWNEVNLHPGENRHFEMKFRLIPPDQNGSLFMRWDLPTALALEQNQMFPAKLSTMVEILNLGQNAGEYLLQIPPSIDLTGWESEKPVEIASNQQRIFSKAEVEFPEVYDSLVIPVSLHLQNGQGSGDSLKRMVYLPATPLTNEGLMVEIDTFYLKYGKANITFHCMVEETGLIIRNLTLHNIIIEDNGSIISPFTLSRDTAGGTNNVDLIFVLDVTGSMAEEIASVRDNIIEFADSLSYRGINYRLGMVTFLDQIESIYPFTDNVQEFQANVSAQYAHGGDDMPENSLEALSVASEFPFRSDANRIIIWITDASYHINDEFTSLTKEVVIDQLLNKGITVNAIGDPIFQTDFYDQIVLNTGGSFYNINGNFRDILLEVSRLGQSKDHLVSFLHTQPLVNGETFRVEIHYAGLGGSDTYTYGGTKKALEEATTTIFNVYPVPVVNETQVKISGSSSNYYILELYNLNGQLLQKKILNENASEIQIPLNRLFNVESLGYHKVFLLKTTALSSDGQVIGYEAKKIKIN